jgi:hypothetical protein
MGWSFQDSDINVPGFDCGDCHGSGSWERLTLSGFNHESTEFPLKGIHKIQDCSSCHPGETNMEKHRFQKDNFDCTSCHIDVHKSELGDNCLKCHTEQTWTVNSQSFDHNQTQFPLLNGHKGVLCNQCHFGESSSKFTATPTDCYSCHLDEFSLTGTIQYPESPNHSSLNYSQDCLLCHSTNKWKDAFFDHDATNFPLVGAHETTDCQSCHADGSYDLPLSCDGCHIENGIATSNAALSGYNHDTHNINSNCESCHTSSIWSSIIFDHLNFSDQDCQDCHLPEHTDSQYPPHADGNIDTDCQLCHATTSTWIIENFLHSSSQTGFELTGLHIPADCALCHLNQIYDSTPQNCGNSVCHLNDFNATTDPNHGEYGFPVGYCEHCHETLGWEPDIYSHDVEDVCATCHMPDYNSADDPPHIDFSTTCESCHSSTTTWDDATFTHEGITDGCQNCHMDDFYEEHNDGDPTNCEVCHNTINWDEVTFDHDNDYFPIFSGEHEDEWTTCTAECHIVPEDFSQFSCGLNGICHEHRQTEMDDEHDDESGYVYESSACYNCHPNGEEDDDDDDDDDLRQIRFKREKEFMKKFPNYLPQ